MSPIKCIIIFTIVLFETIFNVYVRSQPADSFAMDDLHKGISSFSIPAEERLIGEPYVLAYINYTYATPDGDKTISHEKGKYGEGRILNVRGELVHVTTLDDTNDHTACSPYLKGTLGRPLPLPGTWIALIKRGKCNFEDKVKHAYNFHALGVIVYNDRESVNLDKMKIVELERNITAVFTYKWLGEELAKLVEDGIIRHASISEGRTSKIIPSINRTSVLFVSISFIVLMIISLVWLVFYYVQRFRYLQTKDRKSRQLCSVAKRIIAKIPTKSIKSDDKEIENDCCAICIEPYKVTDLIRMLPCRHEFHKSCIDPWLLEHRTCPMCKMDILKHYGFVFTGSQESILQLDLDTEDVDGSGVGEETVRARSVSPTFIIQLDHERRSSVESVASMQRDVLPQSTNDNSSVAATTKSKCAGCAAISKKYSPAESDENYEKIRESISLPCTLKKCKSSESCRGSNNCYVWALDFEQLSRRMDKLEKGCPKSRTTCIENRDSDNEFLLADKMNADSSPEHGPMSSDGTTSENVTTTILNDCKKNHNDMNDDL